MLTAIAALILVLWLVGLLVHAGGAAIHFLLVLALVVFVFDWFDRRRPPL